MRYLHKGGFRVILRGSLLCPDHSLRYLIHGMNGSWREEGMDPQEALLLAGHLPKYPTSTCDPLTGRPHASYHGYGVEARRQWGVFTLADGSTNATLPELGSYFMFYDDLHSTIVNNTPPPVSPLVAIQVLKIIELAKLSSQYGEVLDFPGE
jgi:scyllo-inositol 2-dehydrogenase (NADP+)